MADTWTIRRVLKWTADDFAGRGIDSARLDAELLVAHALGVDRVRLYMDLDRPLVGDELAAIRALVGRRRQREPVAYILGRREFYGRRFEVSPAVLVPRPETELLVDRALELLAEDAAGPVLDLCTGSGAIAITLAAERAALEVDATDLSEAALEVARRNAAALGVGERVHLFAGDLFAPLAPSGAAPRSYALIACNPPYVAERERASLAPEVAAHEPSLALFGGADGLSVLRRLCAEAPRWLAPEGRILIEIGIEQGAAVSALLRDAGFRETVVRPDLSGRDRLVEGTL
jgi:release factor glutamine methyltransferase